MPRSDTSLDEGKEGLRKLIVEYSPLGPLSNEAETRFQFIDELLTACLGWQRQDIHVEVSEDGERTDYEIGSPRAAIWEAKKSSLAFQIPARRKTQTGIVHRIQSLVEADPALGSAFDQCRKYCIGRGVQIAVIANGPQLVAFLATRTDGANPMQGNALVWNGYEQLLSYFSLLWQTLSAAGVDERRLVNVLSGTARSGIPRKLSSLLLEYPRIRYTNDLQEDLRTVANLLIEDVRNLPEVEAEFYRECYCESGALSQYALLTKAVMNSRYAELFSSSEARPDVTTARQDPESGLRDAKYFMAEAVAKRPIVLLGDVGVGKTSFLKNLIYVRAAQEFADAVYIYVNLGSQFPVGDQLGLAVLRDIKRQLLSRYQIDVDEWNFIRSVYHFDIQRFRQGIWGYLADSNDSLYQERLRTHLFERTSDLATHLEACINHIARGRSRPVIVMLDNADQRSFDIQQQAFVLAETLAKTWTAFVFVAVRPRTYHHSKRAGSLSAYPQRVFAISPPRVELMVEKRLHFALKMAEGRLPVESIRNLSLKVDSLAAFLKALLAALEKNKQIAELLANVTGGNMREVMELITRFISTPNVDAKKIIEKVITTGHYEIPLHEFSKVAILGDYAHYHAESSLALNLFDVFTPDSREHFLRLCILGLLKSDVSRKNSDGFLFSEEVTRSLQDHGYVPLQTEGALRQLANKRLIESSERVTFEEDALGELIGDMPAAFRLTSVGAYHLDRWVGTFAYVDAMTFDTPIFEDEVFAALAVNVNAWDIQARLERANAFKEYLSGCWAESGLDISWLSWQAIEATLDASFEDVRRGIAKQARRQALEKAGPQPGSEA
jgi:hypothetical protein